MSYPKTATIHITTKDYDFDSTVSEDDFVLELDDSQVEQINQTPKAKHDKLLLSIFEDRVKQAVTDWLSDEPQDVRDEIDEYCGGYNFEAEADEGQPELAYALEHFCVRSVAHVPEQYLNRHGVTVSPAPDLSVEYEYIDPFFGQT